MGSLGILSGITLTKVLQEIREDISTTQELQQECLKPSTYIVVRVVQEKHTTEDLRLEQLRILLMDEVNMAMGYLCR